MVTGQARNVTGRRTRVVAAAKMALRVAATLLTVGLVLVFVDGRSVLSDLRGAGPGWLLIMYASMFSARGVDAWRLAWIMRSAGSPVGAFRAFLANSLSAFYSMVVPGDIVASAAKWANLSAVSGERARSFNAIVYNRVVLLIPPLMAGSVAIVLDPAPGLGVTGRVLGVLAAALVCLMIVFYNPFIGGAMDRLVATVLRPVPDVVSRPVVALTESLRDFRGFGLLEHGWAFLLSAFSAALTLGMVWAATETLGLSIPLLSLVWIYAAVIVIRQVPITIGGLGVREGFLVLALAPYGISAESSVSLGLVLFTNAVMWGLIGGAYQIALTLGWARWGREEA